MSRVFAYCRVSTSGQTTENQVREIAAAGFAIEQHRVVEAAPIVGYMKKQNWTRTKVRDYCRTKGWKISIVHEHERPDD